MDDGLWKEALANMEVTMELYVVVVKLKEQENLKYFKIKAGSSAKALEKARKFYGDRLNGIKECLTYFRYNEIKTINEWLKNNTPKSSNPVEEKKCYGCKSTLKRKHLKWKFRNLETGKMRHYCEECVEEIDPITFCKLELIKVY